MQLMTEVLQSQNTVYALAGTVGFFILDHYFGFETFWSMTLMIGTFADRYIGANAILALIIIVLAFYVLIFYFWLPRLDEKQVRDSFVQRVDRDQFELHQKRLTLEAMQNLRTHPRYQEVVEEGTTTRRESVASGRASLVNSRTGTGNLD